jgi:hypothetical protein
MSASTRWMLVGIMVGMLCGALFGYAGAVDQVQRCKGAASSCPRWLE